MMQGAFVRNAVPVSPRPSGRSAEIAKRVLLTRSLFCPFEAAIRRNSSPGSASAIVVEVNLPPSTAAAQTSSNISARDLARMIASLVALSAANMRVSRSFCSSVLRLFLGAVEIVEGERNVFREPRKQLHQIVGECALFAGKKQQHADGLAAVLQQRKTRAGSRSVLPCKVMPMGGSLHRPGNRS